MKRFNIIKTVSVAAFTTTLLFASCTGNFDELNTHPTDVYPEDMTPTERVGTLFVAMTRLLNACQENNSQHTEQMVGSMAGILQQLLLGMVLILEHSILVLTG